jgi:hypothetical protein
VSFSQRARGYALIWTPVEKKTPRLLYNSDALHIERQICDWSRQNPKRSPGTARRLFTLEVSKW